MADYKRAARTIYLNKACFNGLYRVNSNDEFNVPFGKKNKVNIYDGQNLGIVHCILNFNDIEMLSVDFEEAVKNAKKGDFVYLDPPYDSDTKTFTDYTENGFGKDEQIRLAEVFKNLSKKGCYNHVNNNYDHNTKNVSIHLDNNCANNNKENLEDKEIKHDLHFYANTMKERKMLVKENLQSKQENKSDISMRSDLENLNDKINNIFNSFFEYYEKNKNNLK